MIEWLLAPIDSLRPHDLSQLMAWHARLMLMAWGVLVPLGILIARFMKVLPQQNWPEVLDTKFWWISHRLLQYLGGALSLFGAALILYELRGFAALSFHTAFGWLVVICGVMQILGGWLRGSKGGPTAPAPDGSLHGDHFDMTLRRKIFEYVHKFLGYLALFIAMAVIISGLWRVNAPHWMWLALALWWGACIFAFIFFQRRGYAMDTYQAIWGADPTLPGNQIKPIGWGIHRAPLRHVKAHSQEAE